MADVTRNAKVEFCQRGEAARDIRGTGASVEQSAEVGSMGVESFASAAGEVVELLTFPEPSWNPPMTICKSGIKFDPCSDVRIHHRLTSSASPVSLSLNPALTLQGAFSHVKLGTHTVLSLDYFSFPFSNLLTFL